jgi:hypothetical protein
MKLHDLVVLIFLFWFWIRFRSKKYGLHPVLANLDWNQGLTAG